jgi:hypothetical protein
MATWHQRQRPVRYWSETEWTVVVDPPNQMTYLYRTSSRDLAEVYIRGLKANNPGAAAHAYILNPFQPAKV